MYHYDCCVSVISRVLSLHIKSGHHFRSDCYTAFNINKMCYECVHQNYISEGEQGSGVEGGAISISGLSCDSSSINESAGRSTTIVI